MGVLTITDFRTDMQTALGNRGYSNTLLDRWLNLGYMDLCGSINFPELDTTSDQATVASTQTIATPTTPMVVKLLRDTTNDRLLNWLPEAELMRRKVATEGEPLYWTRHGSSFYLHPVPDDAYTIRIFYKSTPAVLSTGNATTVLTAIWDPAVFELGVHHALLLTAQEQRAAAWLARAIAYIQTKVTDDELRSQIVGLDASLANMTARLEALRSG